MGASAKDRSFRAPPSRKMPQGCGAGAQSRRARFNRRAVVSEKIDKEQQELGRPAHLILVSK